jgi:hypothetical protein
MVSCFWLVSLSTIAIDTVNVSPTVPPLRKKMTSFPSTVAGGVMVQLVDDEVTVALTMLVGFASQRL